MNNSIVHQRLLAWCDGGVLRLHSPDITFYVQSARESADLLLAAGLNAERARLRIHAITDLGWPVCLLDLALGLLLQSGSAAPVYFSGYAPGYESTPFPGLYDPATAGSISPLISAFEAPFLVASNIPSCDAFTVRLTPDPLRHELLHKLEAVCESTAHGEAVRTALDDLSWSLFEGAMAAVPRAVLARIVRLTAPHRGSLPREQARLSDAIQRWADVPDPPPTRHGA